MSEALERARVLAPAPRCPYCHEGCAAQDPLTLCRECAARHHAECWRDLGRCAACGHERGLDEGPPAGRAAPSALRRLSLATALLLAVAGVVVGARARAAARPLPLQVDRPAVSGDLVRVEGRVAGSRPRDLLVRVAGVATPVAEDGAFRADLRLPDGAQQVEVLARAGQRQGRALLDVTVQLPPRLRLDPAPHLVHAPRLELAGRIDDASPVVTLHVEDVEVWRGAPGRFTVQVPLRAGSNTLRVHAADEGGRSAAWRHDVFADVPVAPSQPPPPPAPPPPAPPATFDGPTIVEPTEGAVVSPVGVRIVLFVPGQTACDLWLDGEHLSVLGPGDPTLELALPPGVHVLEAGHSRERVTCRRTFEVRAPR